MTIAGRLLELHEAECEELARALHDLIGSNLAAINLDVAGVVAQLAESTARARLARALDVLKETVEVQRRLTQALRPTTIDSLGLVETLRTEVEHFMRGTGVACTTRFEEPLIPPDPRVAIVLYRLVQGCLRSLAADGRATRAALDLSARDGCLNLAIDGDVAPDAFDVFTIHTMRARVVHFGGTLEFTCGLHAVRLAAHVPARPQAA